MLLNERMKERKKVKIGVTHGNSYKNYKKYFLKKTRSEENSDLSLKRSFE
jgi:peptidyl-tRNA hydrolase